ncbi:MULTISPECIES: MarR family winged helix-turn-helix transcriptional regulator [Streptomyces]|uniref:MarR family transcriptional regulator n=1 Tax=Streptomyces dengpaensis TaxID=2049881 RepID=A0ABN5ICK2_9ACTN|nr:MULTISPECIES: MarR family winged helix-turn-helix transcriptional regulator [Streptomyces]AVH60917.1 MarR family transcriptional regulator [Streptomyces dengpaensis]PIB04029.1 MarR family transcriptional regulator [Streptomyces sp. HG99]
MEETVRWLTPEEQHAWRSFVRLQERLRGRLSRLLQTESNVSPADFAVLVELTDAPDGRQRFLDLARALEWEKSRISHQISRMVKRGLVVREECPEDGRGAFVVITDAGRAMIEAAASRHVEAVRALFLDHVTPAELRTLAQISERVVEKLDEDAS